MNRNTFYFFKIFVRLLVFVIFKRNLTKSPKQIPYLFSQTSYWWCCDIQLLSYRSDKKQIQIVYKEPSWKQHRLQLSISICLFFLPERGFKPTNLAPLSWTSILYLYVCNYISTTNGLGTIVEMNGCLFLNLRSYNWRTWISILVLISSHRNMESNLLMNEEPKRA